VVDEQRGVAVLAGTAVDGEDFHNSGWLFANSVIALRQMFSPKTSGM
jgi:hypothetical protein